MKTEKLDEALADLDKIIELDPSAAMYQRKRTELAKQIDERNEKLKQEMLGKLKTIAKDVAQKKFEYTVEQSFKKLLEIQDLAMEANQKDGEYYNLGTAAKVEELKAKLCGLFEIDNKQKSLPISINFINNYE